MALTSSLPMPGGAVDTIEQDEWLPYYGPTPIAAKLLEYNDDLHPHKPAGLRARNGLI